MEASLNALPCAAFLVDLDDLVLGWNPAAADLLGMPADEAIGRPFRDLEPSYKVPQLRAALERIKGRPERQAISDVSFERPDGSPVVTRVTVAPVADRQSRVVAILVTLEDRTNDATLAEERDQLAEEIASLTTRHEMAETRLLEATDELQSANEELTVLNEELQNRVAEQEAAQTADRQKTEFLAMLSHELRTPLAAIVNAVHVIRLQDPRDQVMGQASRVVERQVKHLARLLEDLLDVARIQQGKLELRKEPVDLAVAAVEALEGNQHLFQSGRHGVSVALPEGELIVEGDPIRLVQVFGNLLNNAAKYTEPGGQISVTGHREGADAVVSVKDTGLGIASDLLPRVFDLFAQADTSLVHSRGGLGVGLTLVRQLLEMHGGRVTAHSEGLGHGSQFVVRLPLRGGPAPREHEVPPGPSARIARRRILVVEDSRDSREMLRIALELEGHDVRVAVDGPQGVREAGAQAPDVVLVDIGLPGLDGYEVGRQIRSLLGESVVLIALTGYGDVEARRRTVAAGFDHHVVKPVDPVELAQLAARSSGGTKAPRTRGP